MQAHAGEFVLSSPDVADGVTIAEEQVYAGFGCHGGNLSPALFWSQVPEGTRSFAVTVHDSDSPRPGGWWHWLLFNIPVDTEGLPKGAGTLGHEPAGSTQSLTSFGTAGYGGPCPPAGHGVHHYVFTVYALDTEELGYAAGASPEQVAAAIRRHAIASASLTVLYQR
ncbi:MAG TPA: YbhB/YbcL family Raf kinase inhibitor-like protein [Mariprofundaceae bacterium]|nr:YbhB/YbcL family Raf kinase inhibitor-like protein [Mariprofundaceae bacterium]